MLITHVERLKLKNHDAIVLVRAKDAKGRPFWLYIRINVTGLETIRRAHMQSESLVYNDLGTILRDGDGHEPPQAVKDFMTAEYGFMHEEDQV